MEAAAEELSPGFKFQPTAEELVACYLLPRILGHPVPLGDDDPRRTQPRDLLRRHGRDGEAFFFTSSKVKYRNGHRQDRGCAGGGTWRGQKNVDGEPLRVGGVEIEWRKYALNFYLDGCRGSTGWVMHEYAVTSPADLASSPWKLCRVRLGGYGQKRKREAQDSSDDDEGEARGAARRAFAAPSPLAEEDHGAAVSECSAMPETSTSDQDASAAAQFFDDVEPPEGWKETPDSFNSFVPPEPSTSDQDAAILAVSFDDLELPEGWENMFN